MIYHSYENKEFYFPPLLSNGEISLAPDAEGMLSYTAEECSKRRLGAFDGIVVRARRRSALCSKLYARLFPMGKFTFEHDGELESWSQELVDEKGFFKSECLYDNGDIISSTGFIHPEYNIYALRKSFNIKNGRGKFSYTVRLYGYDNQIGKYMNVSPIGKKDGTCRIGFKMYGMEVFEGEIRAFVDKDYTAVTTEDGIKLSFDVYDGETVTFYYYLEDNVDGVDFRNQLKNYEKNINTLAFDGLLAECTDHYAAFSELGYVNTSDEKLNDIYKTSLYSIKCNTTKYSIAVGFNSGYWDGKYFPFDEYTSFFALLGANRLELAKRVPIYRLKSCLPTAIVRGSDCHRTELSEDVAHFHWVSGEVDTFELASNGCWQDHIFHIPLIGIAAFNYYEYSQDSVFLSECYPMIRACSKFITKHMVYRDGDTLYIGKCTDLERLGASVENPFLTVCGAIKLLECCSKSARILGQDEDYANECDYIAQKLANNLPTEDEMYVPHLECKQKSIAVFGGKYPFDVVESDDTKLLRAWDDFEQNGAKYGNMYPYGKGISPWYACWKALGYARVGMRERAYASLKQSYSSSGVFGEMFEINEESIHMKPWFATAAGIFVSSVNEMLLQSDESTIKIMPGIPHTVDASFKLAAKGGVTVEATVKGEKLKTVTVTKDGYDVTNRFKIKF